ncbi:MAG: phosphoglucosamine mutase [Candidatus Aenigmarchaeota archaeon]|nr:phosphoglucosamine mutase [Candidatus Aenigmarchaeota archaeon]
MKAKFFGTDGIRGIVGEYPLTDEIVKKIAFALSSQCSPGTSVLIGRDTRKSGEHLEHVLASAFQSCGINVMLAGVVPTSGVSFLMTFYHASYGIMISASHNPAVYNGIKIFGHDGLKLSAEQEHQIEEVLVVPLVQHPAGSGTIKTVSQEPYITFLTSLAHSQSHTSLKVVVDPGYGAAYAIAEEVYKKIGLAYSMIHHTPNGNNINKGAGSTHPEQLASRVRESGADIGLAFDGDADRLILVDEQGTIRDGDVILYVCGCFFAKNGLLEKNTIVGTVMSNGGFEQSLLKHNIALVRTPVGDAAVYDEIKKHGYSLGGEPNGHIFFPQEHCTGDAILTSLHILSIMQKTKQSLSQLCSDLMLYPQVLLNIPVHEKKELTSLPMLMKTIRETEKSVGAHDRVLVRYSGTENVLRVFVEGPEQTAVQKHADHIATVARQELGVA